MATSIVHVVLHMKKKHMSISDSLNQAPMPLVMVVLGFLGAGYPLALTFFHIFVASRGESTHEFVSINSTRMLSLSFTNPAPE